jgi:hypothetical protein
MCRIIGSAIHNHNHGERQTWLAGRARSDSSHSAQSQWRYHFSDLNLSSVHDLHAEFEAPENKPVTPILFCVAGVPAGVCVGG